MSMLMLDKLLGRSTIDPTVLEAFNEGRIDEVLDEYDFSPEIRGQLRGLEAENFSDFAQLAYQVIKVLTKDDQQLRIPNPMEGLQPEHCQAKEEQAA
jgi:hypothetical protein